MGGTTASIMRAHRRAALLYAAFVTINLGVGLVLPILPLFAKELGASPFFVGAVGAMQYAGMVATSVPVSRVLGRYGSERPMIVGTAVLVATSALSGVSPAKHGWPLLAIAQFLYGIAYNLMLLGQVRAACELLSGNDKRARREKAVCRVLR